MAKTKPEFTVALGPSVYIADTDDDNDKTPVPSGSQEQPFGQLIKHGGYSEGMLISENRVWFHVSYYHAAKK